MSRNSNVAPNWGHRDIPNSVTNIHHVLTNHAGAYVYGKTRQETTLYAAGARKKSIRYLPRSEWQVLIPEHHSNRQKHSAETPQ